MHHGRCHQLNDPLDDPQLPLERRHIAGKLIVVAFTLGLGLLAIGRGHGCNLGSNHPGRGYQDNQGESKCGWAKLDDGMGHFCLGESKVNLTGQRTRRSCHLVSIAHCDAPPTGSRRLKCKRETASHRLAVSRCMAILSAARILLQLEVGKRNVRIAKPRVDHPTPVGLPSRVEVARFGSPLAVDAHGGVGQGLQAGERDLGIADLAIAVGSLPDAIQGAFDVREFAALDLGQLGTDFVLGGIEGRIDDVAARLIAKLLEQAQVARQGTAECVAALD